MTYFPHMGANTDEEEPKENKCAYIKEKQLPAKFASFSHPSRPFRLAGATNTPRLYCPRWRWRDATTPAPPVLGQAPQLHPLDILGVLDPPPTAASILCTFPDAILSATEKATQAFGAPPFAVLLTVLAACEAFLPLPLRTHPDDPPIRVGLFGPGAAAARRAAMAIHPEASRHLIDLYAIRGIPSDLDEDPLPLGVWPVLCPAYLPARPAPVLAPMPLATVLADCPHEILPLNAFSAERAKCSKRLVLASICADDAEAQHFPPDARRRVSGLPRLMDRLCSVLTVLVPAGGDPGPIRRFEQNAGLSLIDEMVESALELAMVARAHLIAFYARVRPARTGPVQRAAAALLRHRPYNVSASTLTSRVIGRDLHALEASGWLEQRDEDAPRRKADRFTPTSEFLAMEASTLPRKRPSQPHPVCVLCEESGSG